MPLGLEINLLGEFKLLIGSVPVASVNTPRLQALLAYLLLHRDAPQPRQHIAFLFWPDSNETQAQSNLRNLLVTLRRLIPALEEYVIIERRTFQWRVDSPFAFDVAQFEDALANAARAAEIGGETGASPGAIQALRRVDELYTGDLLPSCYDEWIVAPRERLRQGFMGAIERLVAAFAGRGELGEAILYAQRLLRYDPFREENYRRLMRLHLANGDRAGVVSIYRYCEMMLRRELDLEPSPATRELLNRAEVMLAPVSPDAVGTPVEGAARGGKQGNIPAWPSVFIGREREVVAVLEMLRHTDSRLVTLTGVAGVGKTRLGIRVAAGVASAGVTDMFPDGAWFVPLAAITQPDGVLGALGQALGVRESGGRSLRGDLFDLLREKRLLLLLDNFEHLLPAASVVADLLSACPGVKVLVTSQAVLHLRGEREHIVQPLGLPGPSASLLPDELSQHEAVALFIERALEVSPNFALTRNNARAVADICRKLEGLPLAIELAAARVKVLSPEAILSRLGRRLKLLVGGQIDLPPRQRALESAVAWSYNLLDDAEKSLFRGLSVFAGGCSLQAVEEVLGGGISPPDSDLLERVTSLINKSLLARIETEGGEPRFIMLETLREYGAERLEESGEAEAALLAHALYCVELAEASFEGLKGGRQLEWVHTLELEHANLRAALQWTVEHGEAALALRMAGALGRFWEMRGYLSEGRSWLGKAIGIEDAVAAASPARALAHFSCGMLAVRQRDHSSAHTLLEESRNLYKELGDKTGLSNALNALAVLAVDSDYEQALSLHEESLALRRELGDKMGIATSLYNIAFIKMHQGKWSEAYPMATESLGMWRELDSIFGVARVLYLLGMMAAGQGEFQVALTRLDECLDLCRQLADDWLAAWAQHALGDALYLLGDYERAAGIFAQAEAAFRALGDELGTARTLASLGREAFRVENYGEARRLFDEALAIGDKLENHIVIGCCLAGFAALVGNDGQLRSSALLFGCADDLLTQESTTLERCGMTFNMAQLRAALDVQDPAAWEAGWEEGKQTYWQDAAISARAFT